MLDAEDRAARADQVLLGLKELGGTATAAQVWQLIRERDQLTLSQVREALKWVARRSNPAVTVTGTGAKGDPFTWKLTPKGRRILRKMTR